MSDLPKNDLIDKLSNDLKPVRVLSLKALATQYWLTLVLFGAGAMVLLGAAQGWLSRLARIDFLAGLLVFGFMACSGAILLAQDSRPGLTLSRPMRSLFWISFGLAFVLQLFRWVTGSASLNWGPPIDKGWNCAIAALAIAAVTSAAIVFELRRQAPVRLVGAARLLLVTSGAMAALVLQIHCPNENPVHEILWHIALPLGVLVLSARSLSRLALRW